jgi:hypothetical protein
MSKRKVVLNENSNYQINPVNLIIPESMVLDVNKLLENVGELYINKNLTYFII